jgi:hypothetical protein
MTYDQKPDRRHDDVSAAYVDAAITIGKLISLNRAENLLMKQGFASETIVRVLHNVGPHRPHRPATLPPVSLHNV